MSVSLCSGRFCRFFLRNVSFQTISYYRRFQNDTTNTNSPLKQLLDEATSYSETSLNEPELQWATEPYTTKPQKQHERRVEPQETTVILFPGQGSQFVGMGRRTLEVPAARELYDFASSIVGWDVLRVCLEGPEEELARRCQTAVTVTALAALELAREQRPSALERARAVAGFSLGELAALTYAGALHTEHALRLVELRASAMRAAAAERAGGMLTVWLAPDARLARALAAARDAATARGVPDPVCQVANYLYPGCKVLAGDEEALRFLEREGASYGVRRAARVRVQGAFHSALMARAGEAVRAAVERLEVHAPRVRVVSGATGAALRSASEVRRALARGVCRPVRWEQALHALYARPRGEAFPLTLALGPGGALRSTLRQVNARAWDASVQVDV